MTIELNRRTFLALIGASTTAVAIGRPAPASAPATGCPQGTPRCFMDGRNSQPAARPKTSAIQYLSE
ncbi:hypothetical protein P4C99_13690 [Pontiellaceae bacterium B1224]|nr:hypothetical protein [Pontiellaceae bacterium B1224]